MRTGLFSSSKTSSPDNTSSTTRHTFCETLMEDTIESSELIIKRWDLNASSTTSYCRVSNLFRDNRVEAKKFLDAVNDLQHGMQFVIKERSSSELLVRAQNLMEIAMKRLQKEFFTILSSNRYFLDSETVSGRSSKESIRSSVNNSDEDSEEDDSEIQIPVSDEIENVSDVVMADLKAIADCMIGSGYGRECVKIYRLNRKSVIDETLYHLRIEKLSYAQIKKMDWVIMEKKIKSWLSGVKVAVSTLFHGERILCDHVFSVSDNIRETCFSEIAKDSAINLFAFPEMVAKYKKLSMEKMFRALDLYDAIYELWTEIELIFSYDSTSVVKSQAVASMFALGEAARTMLSEFESAIRNDSSKAVPGGGIHPLTRYVMNYLVFLSDYSGAVSEIVVDWPLSLRSPLPESYYLSPTSVHEGSTSSAVSERLAWLILVLLCKLDGKSQLYKDAPLSYLFLANNLNYVVTKVRKSNLKLLLGSDWLSKHETKVIQYVAKYERMGWSKVLTSLPENLTADISLPEAMECFSKFNSGFEEAYRRQSSWVIPDSKLRDRVKISLARNIVPTYRTFYAKHRGTLGMSGAGVESVIRFAPDDLQNYLSDLFHGAGVSDNSTTWHGSSSPSWHGSFSPSSSSSSPSHGR